MFSTSTALGCSRPATMTVSKSFQPSSPRIAPKWAMLMLGSALGQLCPQQIGHGLVGADQHPPALGGLVPGEGQHLGPARRRVQQLVLAAGRVADLDDLGVDAWAVIDRPPVRRQGGGADQRVVVGIQQQDRQALGNLGLSGAVDEHPVLQLALPFDPARDRRRAG